MSKTLSVLSQLGTGQLGCFTRAQARARGVSDGQLRRLVQKGLLDRVGPRVFRFTASSSTWQQRVMIACLDGGPECLASHRTAAALHRLDGFSPGGIVEVLVPMHVRHRRLDVVVHHTRDLPAQDRTHVGRIPATTIARTLIDIGAVLPASTVEEALDAAERDSAMPRAQLLRRYNELRAPGRNGIGAMTQILQGRESVKRVPRSVLERRFRRALNAARLPLPTPRFLLGLPDRTVELDFAYPALRIGIELDGHGSHATRRQRAEDHERQNAIEDGQWTVRRFTYEQVMFDSAYVVSTLRSALTTAGYRL